VAVATGAGGARGGRRAAAPPLAAAWTSTSLDTRVQGAPDVPAASSACLSASSDDRLFVLRACVAAARSASGPPLAGSSAR